MPVANDWSVGVQLRYWREKTGVLAAEAGERIGVSQQTISGWENDVSLPRWRIATLIDEAYDLTAGMALAVIEGQEPPAGLVEPRAVSIDADGSLVWTARYPVADVVARQQRRPLRAVK